MVVKEGHDLTLSPTQEQRARPAYSFLSFPLIIELVNSMADLSMLVNPRPRAVGCDGKKRISTLVSESPYHTDNVPTVKQLFRALFNHETIPVTTFYEGQKNECTGRHRRGERKLAPLRVGDYPPRSPVHSG